MSKCEAFDGGRNARRSLFARLARHRALRLRPLRRTAFAIESRMQLPQGAGHGDAGVDAGQGVSALAAGKPFALPALRISLCGRALSAASPRRRALTAIKNVPAAIFVPSMIVPNIATKDLTIVPNLFTIAFACSSREAFRMRSCLRSKARRLRAVSQTAPGRTRAAACVMLPLMAADRCLLDISPELVDGDCSTVPLFPRQCYLSEVKVAERRRGPFPVFA